MDFEISEQMTTILEMVRDFMDREVIPLEGEMLFGDPGDARGAGAGSAGQGAPDGRVGAEPSGGVRRARLEHGRPRSAQRGARTQPARAHVVFGTQAPDAGNIEILHMHATDEQRERYLRPLVAGEIRSCFSMTEPETAGSNPLLLETTAVEDGDEFVINGQKWFTSSADGADFAIVMAVTDPDAPPYARTSMILVPTDTPGFNLVRNVSVMGHAGSGHASHGEVIYQGCRVPTSNLLGPRGGGFTIAQERLGPGRIHHCMRWLGIASRSFDLMCARANERVIDPNGDTLADRQVIQHWAAELDAEIRGARLQTLHAAWMIDQHGAKAARDEIAAIKFSVANTMLKAVDTADPGARCARRHRRHGARLLVPPRACRPHLRRRRRGPQDLTSVAASCAATPRRRVDGVRRGVMTDAAHEALTEADVLARIRPGRTITGMSAVLLPFTADGEIDWDATEAHIDRTVEAGLTPAVNMDTGYVQLLTTTRRPTC